MEKDILIQKEKLEKMHLLESVLVKKKAELKLRKKALKQRNLPDKCDQIPEGIQPDSYGEVYTLLEQIYQHEVKILEMRDQVERRNFNEEREKVRNSFQRETSVSESYKRLHAWYCCLQAYRNDTMDSAMDLVNVTYSQNGTCDSDLCSVLRFTVVYRGVAVYVQITSSSHSDHGGSSTLSILSDPYIDSLSTLMHSTASMDIGDVLKCVQAEVQYDIAPTS